MTKPSRVARSTTVATAPTTECRPGKTFKGLEARAPASKVASSREYGEIRREKGGEGEKSATGEGRAAGSAGVVADGASIAARVR